MKRATTVALLLALASLSLACSKDKKDDGDAAADAAPAAIADAAPEAAADAGADAADAAVAPLATTAKPVQKAPPPEPAICANARAAKARNSPAAPGLEAQCKAAGGKL